MSRFKKTFMGTDCNQDNELQVTNTDLNEITIEVMDYYGEEKLSNAVIRLDISTAISFSKELRRLINAAKNI